MLKGVPQNKRDSRWHKRHLKKLTKDKLRHRRGHNLMPKNNIFNIERKLKKARKEKPKMSWSRRLLLWFIASKLGAWIQNKLEKHHERQYKG